MAINSPGHSVPQLYGVMVSAPEPWILISKINSQAKLSLRLNLQGVIYTKELRHYGSPTPFRGQRIHGIIDRAWDSRPRDKSSNLSITFFKIKIWTFPIKCSEFWTPDPWFSWHLCYHKATNSNNCTESQISPTCLIKVILLFVDKLVSWQKGCLCDLWS